MGNAQMPQYKCHKVVRAAKIARITPFSTDGDTELRFEDGNETSVSAEWMQRCKPEVGGYFVAYDDGYASYSPAKAFEEGYTPIPSDHRDRVRAEQQEMSDRLARLFVFFQSVTFARLPEAERTRLRSQARFMDGYVSVLEERIAAFNEQGCDVATAPAEPPASRAETDDAIEREIVFKGLTAPRVTPADIEANITYETYFTAAQGSIKAYFDNGDRHHGPSGSPSQEQFAALSLLTFCVLVLRNGFTVTGESACASPENFDAEIGRKIARQNAVAKVWPLMGYALKERLAAGDGTEPA
jgi:hypothetical protein